MILGNQAALLVSEAAIKQLSSGSWVVDKLSVGRALKGKEELTTGGNLSLCGQPPSHEIWYIIETQEANLICGNIYIRLVSPKKIIYNI